MQLNMKNSSNPSASDKSSDLFCYEAKVPDYFFLHHKCSMDWSTSIGDSHTHPFCEITVYLEDLKCLFVNDTMYISETPCIFTFRPWESHYAIHNNTSRHERFMMFIVQDAFFALPGGHELLRCLFDRKAGEHNMIILPSEDKREAFQLLDSILSRDSGNLPERNTLQLADVIHFLSILNKHYLSDTSRHSDSMSSVLRQIITYIGNNLTQPLRVSTLAQQFNISQSTLERIFRTSLTMTPKEYIIRRRMDAARAFLRQGQSVADACTNAGFGDYSRFIADFRRMSGITPAEYARQHRHEGESTWFPKGTPQTSPPQSNP